MKISILTIVLLLTVGIVSQAQTVTDSWAFGFGLTYPRYVSVNIQPLNSNFGGYLSIQKNFSENIGLRLKGGYYQLEGEWTDVSLNAVTETTNLLAGDLDLLYYVLPCEPITPYLLAGTGVALRMLSNNVTTSLDDNASAFSFNVGGGVEWTISSNWKILTEYSYHATFNSELDGAVSIAEVNGRDSYMTLNLGLLYYFSKGKPSDKCKPCQGITQEYKDLTDYDRIDEMIKNHIPKEVIKEVVVDRYIVAVSDDKLVLVGVKFAFDKSDLLPESYVVLDKAVVLLKEKPDVRVEIEGYTDYIGTEEYNQQLSVDRAIMVKNYLVSQGIAHTRLSTIGYGKGNPVASNDTEEGRAMNRRIVFRIIK